MRISIDYTIAIRTLGYGGEKYARLLKSIEKLKDKPNEILVVIANGYKKPKEVIGCERFIYSKKGMLEQRIVGIENSKSEYVLLLDDDIEFESEMVSKLYESMKSKDSKISFPIYKELLPEKGAKAFFSSITLSAVSRKEDDYYIKILKSGGYSYPKAIRKRDLYSESAPGMCLFGEVKVFKDLNLREESWVTIPEYELRDDAVIVYKAFQNGIKTVGRSDIYINHLDNSKGDKSRINKGTYALGCSQIKFWKRYLANKNKVKSTFMIIWWCITTVIFKALTSIKNMDLEDFKALIKGIKRGIKNE